MRIKKIVEVPATTHEIAEGMSCDLCGKTSTVDSWAKPGSFDVNEITVKSRKGYSYPESTRVTDAEVDLCPDCFHQKLVPWLESQGAKVRVTEVDY